MIGSVELPGIGCVLLQRRHGWRLAGRAVFRRAKGECRQQRKTHDEGKKDEVLLSHPFSPATLEQFDAHRSAVT
jgi:hypothetical protein